MAKQFYTEDTQVQTVKLLDGATGSLGALSGGELLAWMDISACMAAEKFAGESCVTLLMDDLYFSSECLHALKKGDLLVIKSQVNRPFGTSMEVGVTVTIEDILTGETKKACSCYMMFVLLASKDQQGNKKNLPSLTPNNDVDRSRFDLALDRRNIRMQRNDTISQALTQQVIGSPSETNTKQQDSLTQFTELILPSHANHMGNLFGGQAMKWMESAAYVSALRHARVPLHLCTVDYIQFFKPAVVGDRVHVSGVVTHVFNDNSMEVMVNLHKQSLSEGVSDMALSAFFVYKPNVVLGGSKSVPQIEPLPAYSQEYQKALGREKVRIKRQVLRGETTLSIKWTPDFDQHEMLVRHLILKNLEALLKLNEQSKKWTVAKSTTNFQLLHGVISKSVTGMAIMGDICAPPDVVFKLFMDPESRKKWDPMFQGATLLKKIDDANAIANMVFKSTKDNRTHNMVLLRSVKKKYAGYEYVIATVSVDYPLPPEAPSENKESPSLGGSRSEVLVSGYILQKTPSTGNTIGTKVISLFQFGGNALNLALNDMVDSSKHQQGDFVQAFFNVKKMAEQLCGHTSDSQ